MATKPLRPRSVLKRLKDMLMALDLEEARAELRVDLRETGSEAKRKKYVKRLKIVEAFIESGNAGMDDPGCHSRHSARAASAGAA